MLKLDAREVSEEQLKSLLLTKALPEFTVKCPGKCSVVIDDEAVHVPTLLEQIIEGAGKTCRIYTEARSTAPFYTWWVPGLGPIASVAAAVGIAAHNLATFDPDFEIMKGLTGKCVRVTNLRKIATDKLAEKQAAG